MLFLPLKKTAAIVADVIFPPRCPVCDAPLPIGEVICPGCRDVPRVIGGSLCRKCGKRLADSRGEYCRDCRDHQHIYDEGRSLYEYTSIRNGIFRLKYAGRAEYARYYGKQMAGMLGRTILSWKPDALIPVPLHPAREKKRGYNQAHLLAKVIGKELDIPVRDRIIRRIRNTVPMKTLDEKQRHNNLKNAFKISRDVVKLGAIVLVDDIYTTGSTMDAMAREFRRSGVENIYFAALAAGRE